MTRRRIVFFIILICLYSARATCAPVVVLNLTIGGVSANMTAEQRLRLDIALCWAKPFKLPGYVILLYYGNAVPPITLAASIFASILYKARQLARITKAQTLHNKQKQPRINRTQTRTMTLLLVCNVIWAVLWIPSIIYTTVDLAVMKQTLTKPKHEEASVVISIFAHATTMVIPLVFAAMQRDFRNAIRLMCGCLPARIVPALSDSTGDKS